MLLEREFMQHPSPIKYNANTKSLNTFCLFYRDHGYDTEELHALKNEIERLIIISYLHQFMKKERKPKHERKEVCILNDLLEIK
jgi:hypothetical protein